MSRVVVRIVLAGALVFAAEGWAQQPSPQPPSLSPPLRLELSANSQSKGQVRPLHAQASPAEQLAACRQNVTQLDEQLRARQKKLVSLRNERKTVGLSGGEVAKFKLTSLDQEIRELSRESERLIAQLDSEGARCEQLAAKLNGRAPAQPQPPQQQQQQRPAKPPPAPRNRQ